MNGRACVGKATLANTAWNEAANSTDSTAPERITTRGDPLPGEKTVMARVVSTAMHPMAPVRTAATPRPNSSVPSAATATAPRVASASPGVQAIAASTRAPTSRSLENTICA